MRIVNQKCTSPYNYAVMVERPDDDEPFDIRVNRLTADSEDINLQNQTIWESYTVFVQGKYSYPNTALVQLVIDTQQFGTSLGEITHALFDVGGQYRRNM